MGNLAFSSLLFFCSILQDMKRKITKVKDFHGTLMETLSDMLAEHFPLPDQQALGTKKKKVRFLIIPWGCTIDDTLAVGNFVYQSLFFCVFS